MAELGGPVASVVEQQEQKVTVSVPLAGCPPGFRLRAGERVVLVNEGSGTVARPLIVSRRVKATPRVVGDVVEIEGERYPVQAAAQIAGASTEGQPAKPGEYDVFFVEAGSAAGPKQVIASRPANPRAGRR